MTGQPTPPADGNGEWLTPIPEDTPDTVVAPTAAASPRARRIKTAVLVAAVLVAGGGVVAAVTHDSGNATAATSTARPGTTGSFPGAPAGPGGADGDLGPGATGGLAGEQHLQGTLIAVHGGSVTVKTSAGTHTYQVTSQTEIVKNGTATTLSQLTAGDTVLVHVYPSGGHTVVERIFAGQLPSFDDGGPPQTAGPGGPGTDDSTTGTTT